MTDDLFLYLFDWLVELIEWFIDGLDWIWLIDWVELSRFKSSRFDWLIDWLIDWLFELIDWLIDWLFELVGWLVGWNDLIRIDLIDRLMMMLIITIMIVIIFSFSWWWKFWCWCWQWECWSRGGSRPLRGSSRTLQPLKCKTLRPRIPREKVEELAWTNCNTVTNPIEIYCMQHHPYHSISKLSKPYKKSWYIMVHFTKASQKSLGCWL